MNKSFTLIEILVVIVVIGILSAFILVGVSSITNSANITKSKAFSESIRNSLLTNLVSEWKFDDGSGTQNTTKDYWNGLSNCTFNNFNFDTTDGWRSDSECISDSCILFDGTNDYITCGNNSILRAIDSVTMVLWLKINNYSTLSTDSIMGFPNRVAYSFWQYSSGGVPGCFVWEIYNDGTRRYMDVSLGLAPLNMWTNVALTYKEGYLTAYKNGAFYLSKNVGQITLPANSTNFAFGQSTFSGKIDEASVYTTGLSLSQIQEKYFISLNKLFKNMRMSKIEFNQRIVELKHNLVKQ